MGKFPAEKNQKSLQELFRKSENRRSWIVEIHKKTLKFVIPVEGKK